MTRRRLLIAITVAALTLIGVGGYFVLQPGPDNPGVTKANYDKIRFGMTRAEVEKLMGGPPGWYVTQPTSPWHTTTVRMGDGSWIGDEGQVEVRYDEDGKVHDKRFVDTRSLEDHWTDKVRRWAGL